MLVLFIYSWHHLLINIPESSLMLLEPRFIQSSTYFSRTPVAPPGTRTLVHNNPHNRGTWAPHGHEGWYVRLEMLHFRYLISYVPNISKERFSDNLDFSPAKLTFSIMSSKDAETHADSDLTHALLNPTPTSPPTTLGDK